MKFAECTSCYPPVGETLTTPQKLKSLIDDKWATEIFWFPFNRQEPVAHSISPERFFSSSEDIKVSLSILRFKHFFYEHEICIPVLL